MILIDTSVWVDHLHRGGAALAALLDRSAVLMRPFVLGELACGSLKDRATVPGLLRQLPASAVTTDAEVLQVIGHPGAVWLSAGSTLWTRDKRLRAVAQALSSAHQEAAH